MRFTIFQMPKSLWCKDNGIFEKETSVRLEDYCSVWTDTISDSFNDTEVRALELVYENFNLSHPRNYAGRSISTGDIVKLNKDYYLCCSIGWSKIQ